MMKRITAIFFVLLATISLLAHAVIPHHHHDGIPVAIVEKVVICGHDNPVSHYHHAHSNHDTHQHGHESEDCLLSDNVLLVFRGQESDFCFSDDGQDFLNTYGYAVAGESFKLPILSEIPKLLYNYRASNSPGEITCSNGLRAPPHC